MNAASRVRRLALWLALAVVCGHTAGCAWRTGADSAAPAPPLPLAAADRARFERLSTDFYGRLEQRRFNSRATFMDPGLREFFRSLDAFSDYYAELAYELDRAHFEASRPTRIEILAREPAGEGRVRLRVRYTGENGLPLRWWSTELVRDELWERDDAGRWWITPGKV